MNIKDKITEWQESFKYEHCFTEGAKKEVDDDLEMIIFAFDTLIDKVIPDEKPIAIQDVIDSIVKLGSSVRMVDGVIQVSPKSSNWDSIPNYKYGLRGN